MTTPSEQTRMIPSRLPRIALAVLLAATAALSPLFADAASEINVYSARKESLIKPLLDAFTAKTGITYRLLTADADQLLARLHQEGRHSPADILITTDAGRLQRAFEAGYFLPVTSPALTANVPARYREPGGHWFGLSLRARVLFYAKDRVDPAALSTYEALTDDAWRGRVCVRSSDNVYNQSLLASIIAHKGADAATAWAAGVVANLARKPQGGDRDQIKAVAAGECDIAVANTYYYGGMLTSPDEADRRAAETVGLFWPNQKDRGAHINISGAGVLKSSRDPQAAIRFLEFLTGPEAQAFYAETNLEYPIRDDVPMPAALKAWGSFKADALDVAALGTNNKEAVRIFDRVGWR